MKNIMEKCQKGFNSLEKLPKLGHKTASVVMSQGFGVHYLFRRYPYTLFLKMETKQWKKC